MIFKERGNVCSFGPETTSLVGGKHATVDHGMCLIEKGSKLGLDAPILLRHTWGSLFEVDPHPFLFAGLFEG